MKHTLILVALLLCTCTFAQNRVKEKGEYADLEVTSDILIGKSNASYANVGLTAVVGYRFTYWFSLSGGVGVSTYFNETDVISLFRRLRFDILRTRVTPVFMTDCGYNFQLQYGDYPKSAKGYFVNVTKGVRWNVGEQHSMFFGIYDGITEFSPNDRDALFSIGKHHFKYSLGCKIGFVF